MSDKKGLKAFFIVVGVLFALRILLAYSSVPQSAVAFLSILSALIFIGAPIYGIYRAASHNWDNKIAFKFLIAGALFYIIGVLAFNALPKESFASVLMQAVGQAGLLTWTLGLGVLLAIFIRDKNLMIPVAIFLIGFDMLLVFHPLAPTAKFMKQDKINAQSALMSVAAVRSQDDNSEVKVQSIAYVGPADLLFSAAFFTLLFRFGMRTKRTLMWLIPVLALYLGVVIIFGTASIGPLSLAMLPAMVPIGLTVLLVNRKEFKLEKQEVGGVIVVTLMSIALAWYGVYAAGKAKEQPLPPPEPLTQVDDQLPLEQPRLPGTGP